MDADKQNTAYIIKNQFMPSQKGSFKKRLITTGAVLSVCIAGFILYVYQLVSQTSRDNIKNIEASQTIKQVLNKISDQLYKTERDVYRLAILPETEYKNSLIISYSELKELSNKLAKIPFIKFHNSLASESLHQKHYHQFHHLSQSLLDSVNELENPIKDFVENAIEVEKRYPGMPILLNELLPRNNQFLEAADLAITETKHSTSDKQSSQRVLELFNQARYLWSQQANWVRLFVSNRYGVFGESKKSMDHSLQNRKLYMNEVKKVIAILVEMDEKGALDLQQSLSIQEMAGIVNEYDTFFIKTRDIYLSEGWRNDLNLLRNNVRPHFIAVGNVLRDFYQVLNSHEQHSIHQSQSVATTISVFVLITGAIIFLTFGAGYFLFEKIIRKPLMDVAQALENEAKGVSSSIAIKNYVVETDTLVKAFDNMKEQVNFRQLRLQSILDNAAEGIITIDEDGNIETFNIAAQHLFGYTSEEVMGKNVSMIIPPEGRDKHDGYLQQLKQGGVSQAIGQIREVYAQTKQGRTFPMSLKLSELNLGGKRYFTAVVENISQRKAMIENLQRLAEHDSLTGLYNRHYFTDELERFVHRHKRGDCNPAALLYIDLDNFKYVNDTMGHLAGDQLIVEAGSLLKSRIRQTDILARLGGDEFAILLYRPKPLRLEEIAETFRKQFTDYVFKFNGQVADICCSIGATMLDDNIDTKEDLLAKADFACHEAKRLGRNRVYIYRPDDDESVSNMSNDIGWIRRIKQALENNRFKLAYQAIHPINQDEEPYNEILIRMLDDDDTIIMPSGFLPAAERFSLMTQIDAWVIEHAMTYMAEQSTTHKPIKLSINLSASSIENEKTLDLIKHNIRKNKLDAQNLVFEVTETIAMGNISKASTMLTQLQKLGCKTALDDFGIGYSSFAYLKDLPVDIVKIDGSFVKGIAANPLHLAMVRSINDIAHAMGKQTIAEFVEDQKILATLKELKVDFAQGYHFGKPKIIEHIGNGTDKTETTLNLKQAP